MSQINSEESQAGGTVVSGTGMRTVHCLGLGLIPGLIAFFLPNSVFLESSSALVVGLACLFVAVGCGRRYSDSALTVAWLVAAPTALLLLQQALTNALNYGSSAEGAFVFFVRYNGLGLLAVLAGSFVGSFIGARSRRMSASGLTKSS